MSNSCNPMNYIAHKAPLSMGFPRQEYRSGLPFPSPIHPVHKCKLGKPLAESVSCSHTHEGSPHKHALSRETPDRHCHRQNHSSTATAIHIQTPSFFSLLGDSPQPWSHEATGWGVSGVCVGDELLKPPSCGQLPRHRMEGLWAACLMKELQGRQARNPEGSRERSGRELSRRGSGCVCVCPACLHWSGPQTQQRTQEPGSLRQKQKAREVCLDLF